MRSRLSQLTHWFGKFIGFTLLIGCISLPLLLAQEPEGPEPASIATTWLSLLDTHQEAETWMMTHPIIADHTPADSWIETLQRQRHAYGPLVSRNLSHLQYHTQIAGLPNGRYIFVYYATAFAPDRAVGELVVLGHDASTWKVIAYVIDPL